MRFKFLYIFVFLFLVGNLVSAVPSTLEEYDASINYSCNIDSDCTIKDVHNCCGYYPSCTNKDALVNATLVSNLCQEEGLSGVCGFPSINSCKCINNKCEIRYDPGKPEYDPNCKKYYWIDDNNKSCGQKQFCDLYMYLGLRTFETKAECQEAALLNCPIYSAPLCLNGLQVGSRLDENDCPAPICVNASENKNYCTDRPKACTLQYDPVCGNNGITYGNSCGACGAGVDYWVQGECAPSQEGCSKDAKICPNGSVVGRTGPNCSFECSEENNSFNLSNGRKAEIKIMPETASQKAIERLGELNFTVELKEVGKGNETRVVYEVKAEKEGKLFGLFKVKGNVSVEVDAEGPVKQLSALHINKPWWAFLASGI